MTVGGAAFPNYSPYRAGTPALPIWSKINPMVKAHRRAAIALGIVLACCACASALDRSLDISQYSHTSWKLRDGFTKGTIGSIAQTPDGYLWLGTDFGLLRFDGVRAFPWQPPAGQQLPSNYIRGLLVARDGTLWISTDKGVASWKAGKLTNYPELAGQITGSLLQDHQGTVWVGLSRPGRLCAIRTAKVECFGAGSFGLGVVTIYEDRNSNLWVSASTGVWRWAPGRPQQYTFPRGVVEANSLIEDDDGVLLIVTNTGLKRLAGGEIQSYSLPGIPDDIRAVCFFRSTDGSLWIGTSQGLLRLQDGKAETFSASDGLSGDHISGIFEDHEGNLWVATYDGLDRFRELAVPRISSSQGLLNAVVFSVQATPDGSIWMATPAGLNRWQSGHMTAYRSRSELDEKRQTSAREPAIGKHDVTEISNNGLSGSVHSLGVDNAGRLWASAGDGAFYFEGGRFVRVSGVPGQSVASIAGDGHGDVWILNGNAGLVYWTPKGTVQRISWPTPRQTYWGSLLPDRLGDGLWLGFQAGGIAYLKDAQVRVSYTAADGLGAGSVNHLRFGSRGALWAATDGGLSRIKDGRVTTLTSNNGLPCDAVHWSMEDDEHAVWLFMPCGLTRIERSELDAWVSDPKHVVRTSVFDSSDGVRGRASPGGYGPHVTKSPDGKIWFAAYDGVSVIDPHYLALNKIPPPVHIERVIADDKPYDARNGLRLPPHVRYLAIDYTALSLVAPEKVRFRYKLEGEDKDWREVINDRQVQYTNLPPKHYRFRVLACNNSGVWNEQGAALEFVIPPAWYQTNWFYALCAAAFLLFLWGLYQLRVLQLRREFDAALEARVGERTRVARELHDTLLQSFHGLLLRFQTVFQLLPERPMEAKEKLGGAIEQAAEAITEGRDAVQGLRDSTVQGNDLALAISTVGEELATDSTNDRRTAFRVAVEGESRNLHPILRDEIYRIAAEALRNAFRHARARQVEVEIRYDKEQFRLRVRDDGKGIDPAVLSRHGVEGHYGLPGMRERATIMGAKLTVWSQVDAGTEVELRIPASTAYATARGRSWLAEKFATKA